MPVLRRRRILASIALGILVLWFGSSALVAWKLTRRARKPFVEPPAVVDWAELEQRRLATSDGQEIGAWLARGSGQNGCVLLLHGNGESRRKMLPVMRMLADAQFTVLAVSLRAHGDSTGTTNDIGWSARHDVVAAVDFLHHEFPRQPVFVVGRSLGAAAAIFSANELGGKVSGYFLEQPYKDLRSAVWNRLQNHLPPVFDWAAYIGLRIWAPVFLPVDPDRISPLDQVEAIPADVPVLIVTGSADRHARLEEVEEIHHRIKSHSRLEIFRGAAHVPLDRYDPELYRTTLLEFLNRSNH